MTELKRIYVAYIRKAGEVRRKASPMAGFFGMGDDPRNHPCHEEFYDAVKQWVEAFEVSGPDAANALEAVRWILEAPLAHAGNRDIYWFMYAAHGLTMPLIPRLHPADRGTLFRWYDESFPRRGRFPVQQQVWKLLKKGSK